MRERLLPLLGSIRLIVAVSTAGSEQCSFPRFKTSTFVRSVMDPMQVPRCKDQWKSDGSVHREERDGKYKSRDNVNTYPHHRTMNMTATFALFLRISSNCSVEVISITAMGAAVLGLRISGVSFVCS